MINWSGKDPSGWFELSGDQINPSKNKKSFVDSMTSSLAEQSMDLEIAAIVANEIADASSTAENTIFIFTENDYVITGIHVPYEAIGSDGPVLMRGSNDRSVIAAFSRDKIISMLEKLDLEEETTGLQPDDPAHYEKMWVGELEELAQLVRLEMSINPPASWDDLLKGDN